MKPPCFANTNTNEYYMEVTFDLKNKIIYE
jgi:hypothetical protein